MFSEMEAFLPDCDGCVRNLEDKIYGAIATYGLVLLELRDHLLRKVGALQPEGRGARLLDACFSCSAKKIFRLHSFSDIV